MFRHHGLRARKPLRRDDPATGAGAGGDGSSTAGGGGADATPPAAPPTAKADAKDAPPVADVTQTPEFKAAVAQAKADAEAKARQGSKDNARNEVLDQIASALGLKPKEVDPAAIGAELASAREENRALRAQLAIGSAARKLGGDEDLVAAWLAHKGKLKDLDPTAGDFGAKLEALIKIEIEANPKLKAEGSTASAVTPGRQAPINRGTNGGAGETTRPTMHQAITEAMALGQRR
jgi:hypothetical protein